MKAHRCRYSLQMWDTVVYAFSARSARAFTSEYIDIQQRESCNECEQLGTEAVCQCCALWLYYIIMQLRHWKFATKMSHIDQHTDAVFRWRQPCSLPPPFLWAKMSITSDEVNFLVYRYLQESGWSHLYLPEAVMACDTHTPASHSRCFFISYSTFATNLFTVKSFSVAWTSALILPVYPELSHLLWHPVTVLFWLYL